LNLDQAGHALRLATVNDRSRSTTAASGGKSGQSLKKGDDGEIEVAFVGETPLMIPMCQGCATSQPHVKCCESVHRSERQLDDDTYTNSAFVLLSPQGAEGAKHDNYMHRRVANRLMSQGAEGMAREPARLCGVIDEDAHCVNLTDIIKIWMTFWDATAGECESV